MENGYHIAMIPASYYDKKASRSVLFTEKYAVDIATAMSFYSDKTVLVLHVSNGMPIVLHAYVHGLEVEWF